MIERPNVRLIGMIAGLVSKAVGKAWSVAASYIRAALIIGIAILVLPAVAEYWLRHVRIPEVPVNAIVLLLVASFFLLAFAAAVYAVVMCLISIQGTGETANLIQRRRRKQFEPTGGSFVVGTDEESWKNEQIDTLRRQGIRVDAVDLLAQNGVLMPEDKEAVEEMARASALRTRGRGE